MPDTLVLSLIFAAIAAGLIIADNDERSRKYLERSWYGFFVSVAALVSLGVGLFMAGWSDLLRGSLLAIGGMGVVYLTLLVLPKGTREALTSRNNAGWIVFVVGMGGLFGTAAMSSSEFVEAWRVFLGSVGPEVRLASLFLLVTIVGFYMLSSRRRQEGIQ